MRKHLLLVIAALFMVFAAGCVDLFAVPGVAVSPDGGTIYFLGGDFSLSGGDNSSSVLSLSSANVSDGTSKVIVQGDDSSLISAFAVNPTNGEVAYVMTTKAGESGISIYGTDGSSRQLAGKDAFGGLMTGTMMAFSKDGSKIALTGLLFPPEVTPAMLEDSGSDKLTPELMAKIKNVAWLINVADGSVKTISNPDTERANTIAWSPSGNLIAFNTWVDTNGDGTVSSAGISGIPGMSAAAPTTSDLSEVHIYDVGSGNTVKVQGTGLAFGPVFFSDSTVGYVSGDAMSLMGGGAGGSAGFSIATADVGSGASTPFYSGSNLITGVSVSPDGSQVAWAEVESSAASGAAASGSNNMPPAKIFVSPMGTAAAKQVAELNGMFLVDVPVWTPDGKALFVSSTNILASALGGLGSMMTGMSTTTDATAEAPKPQQVTWVDVGSGETKVVYEGGMLNSGMFASLMSIAGIQGLGSMMGAGS
ncbi:MAG: hypothetical protein ABI690_27715 [Chloroflexota bacterium]